METAIWPGKKSRWLPVRPVRCVQPPREHARRPLHRYVWYQQLIQRLYYQDYRINCWSSILTHSSLCFALTAYCKNSIDGQWYCFDDSEVSPVADDDVCQQTAYILFYQRRTAIPSWSANSSVAGQLLFTIFIVKSYCNQYRNESVVLLQYLHGHRYNIQQWHCDSLT